MLTVSNNTKIKPQTFKDSWTNVDEPLLSLARSRLDHFNLTEPTVDFLTIAGRPNYCEPNLSFANDTDNSVHRISKLTEQYDFQNDKEDYEKYIVIGSCCDGDAIAIDTSDNDKVVELDRQDLLSSKYFNSFVQTLADFLIFIQRL